MSIQIRRGTKVIQSTIIHYIKRCIQSLITNLILCLPNEWLTTLPSITTLISCNNRIINIILISEINRIIPCLILTKWSSCYLLLLLMYSLPKPLWCMINMTLSINILQPQWLMFRINLCPLPLSLSKIANILLGSILIQSYIRLSILLLRFNFNICSVWLCLQYIQGLSIGNIRVCCILYTIFIKGFL